MTCRYVLRLYRLTQFHVKNNQVLSVPILAQHARWAIDHLDECALVASFSDVQFLQLLAKGDIRGAYTFYASWPAGPEEDDLGAGCGCFACCHSDRGDGPAD